MTARASHEEDFAHGDLFEGGQPNQAGVSLLDLIIVLLHRRRVIVGLAGVFAIGFGTLAWIRRDQSAISKFVPQTLEPAGGGIANIAAQFGLDLGGIGGNEPVEFYAEVAQSREVLARAAESRYEFRTDRNGGELLSGTYIELMGITGVDREEQVVNATEALQGKVAAEVSRPAGIVVLNTRARWTGLAEALNRRILELLNEFNLKQRQSQATAEREFIAARLDDARQELEAAENAQAEFLSQNRIIATSPQLQFEAARLQRRVDLRQQVYATLAQSLERARIEEVRDTPVITVVESPEGSAQPSASVTVFGILGGMFGVVLGVLVAVVLELIQRTRRSNPSQAQEFEAAVQESLQDLKPRSLVRSLMQSRFRRRG